MTIHEDKTAEVEWHDAHVREVRALPKGEVVVDFVHLVVLRVKDEQILETWSYSAALKLSGVTEFSIAGTWEETEFVSDGKLMDGTSEHSLLQSLRAGISATSFELEFSANGARLRAACTNAQLRELVPVERLE